MERHECNFCITVKSLRKQGVWIHMCQTFDKQIPIQKSNLSINISTDESNINHLPKVSSCDVFKNREIYYQAKPFRNITTTLNTMKKPTGCLWFSHGSWIFDSYIDTTCEDNCPSYDRNNLYAPGDLYAITSKDIDLSKIYIIDTLQKLQEFEKSYVVSYNSVNWDLVRKDGYCGCIFEFDRRTIPSINCFLNGFDVETLVIWDISCVKTVVPIESVIEISS